MECKILSAEVWLNYLVLQVHLIECELVMTVEYGVHVKSLLPAEERETIFRNGVKIISRSAIKP